MKYIILDIDGTICHTPEDLTLEQFYNLDHLRLPPKRDVIDKIYIKYPHSQLEIIYLTSRDQRLYFNTRNWLNNHCIDLHGTKLQLFMRPFDSLKTAYDLKIDILRNIGIEPNHVEIWLDDDEGTIEYGTRKGYNIVHPDKFLAGVNI